MMLAPNQTSLRPATAMPRILAASALASLALAGGANVYAQSSPGGFSLPEPTPTPTAAPQGPVDVRVGVPIGPRVITQEQPATPAPSPTPTPTPTPSATLAPLPPRVLPPEPTPSPAAAPAQTRTPQADQSSESSASAPPTTSAPAPSAGQPVVEPGFESLPIGSAEDAPAAIGSGDGWYDVDSLGQDSAAEPSDTGSGSSLAGSAGSGAVSQSQTYALIALGAVLAVLAGFGAWFWRRRKAEAERAPELAAPVLAAGVRQTIAATQMGPQEAPPQPQSQPAPEPTPQPQRTPQPQAQTQAPPQLKPQPTPQPMPAGPVRLDLQMMIASATRSVMMFTVDYQLTINNRSDHAVRDLSVATRLQCARHSGASPNKSASGAPLELIDRIGPHQARTISGQVQLPLTEVQAIRQGKTPLFIPLLHVSIDGASIDSGDHSFVLGLPSASSHAKVHPIPLDTPPGGIKGLRAQEIKTKAPAPEPAE